MAGPSLDIDVDTFTAYSDALQAAALTTTRLAATSLPADISFHRSIDPVLAHEIDVFSDRVLSLAGKLVRAASGKTSRIQEEEDVVDEFVRNIVDPMEGMLESTDGALDVFLGKKKDPAIPIPTVSVDAPTQISRKKQPFRGRLDPALAHASHLPKPQLSFKHTLSNTDQSPYIPATLIPHKWCAQVPLGYIFHDEKPNGSIEDVLEDDDEEERRKRTLHPYYYELTHPSYPSHVFDPPMEPSLPPSLAAPSPETSHPLTFISTPKALLSVAHIISSGTELAVDLEHHSYRSCRGFLALMQISTRQGDFVVDLLVPEVREGLRQAKDKSASECEEARMANEAGKIIARVFADPSVVKVFHGAESDIVWLQQDFNIFVVGLFDTFHASKLLEFPKQSLAYLLETYCDFVPDKRYQLADWRIRPLPSEMLAYARSDTHFLLYIYDMLRLSLIERASTTPVISDENPTLTDTTQTLHGRGLIHIVLTRSSRTALRLHQPEVYDPESGTGSIGWDTLARKWNKVGLLATPSQIGGTEVQGSQAAVYRAIHRWREGIAREEDESTRYVLPTHQLFLLTERAPVTIPEMLSLLGGPVPPVLKRRIRELVAVIKAATEATKPRSSPQESPEAKQDGAKTVASIAVKEPEIISAMTSSSVAKQTNESRLWIGVPSSTSGATISIPRSALFGIGISEEHAEEKRTARSSSVGGEGTCSAAGSVLLGSASFKTATTSSSGTTRSTLMHAQVSNHSTKHFHDIMEKIHKTLCIAPVASTPLPSASVRVRRAFSTSSQMPSCDDWSSKCRSVDKYAFTSMQSQALDPSVHMDVEIDQSDSVVPEASDLIPPGPEGQIEIPFVPAHKRQTPSKLQNHQLKDDTIVVVGQAGGRQRKRKRDKAKGSVQASPSKPGTSLGGAEMFTSTGDYDQEVEEFDYSSVPNLLDDESKPGHARGVHEEDGRKKKKQRHGKGSGLFEYGNFRAPPRDQREVKSGNKTHTFR